MSSAPPSRPILVTGATGYVGRRLVPRLLADGHPVRALVRRPDKADLPVATQVVQGDLTDRDSLARAVDGAVAVVNLAAVVASEKPPKGGYDRVNADGVGDLARAAAAAGVERFVQMAGVDTAGPDEAGPYLAGRRRGEEAIRASGVPWAVLRPSIMFGGKDQAFVSALAPIVHYAPVVPVPGDGTMKLHLVWVDDVVSALTKLATGEVAMGADYPIGGAEILSYDEMLDAIGGVFDKGHVRKVHIPPPIFRLQVQAMQILPKPPVATAGLELFERDNVAEPNTLTTVFGIEPRGFREHLAAHGLDG